MKYVYVLTSSETDFYYEQFFLSITSFRIYNPNETLVILVDEKTKANLTGKRSSYEQLASEIKVISPPAELNQKEASRWIKTSIHRYVSGDFLFIDCDTVITANLEYDFSPDIKIGAVLDTHVPLANHHLRDDFQKEDRKAGFSSSFETNIRYNGGLIFCKDDPTAHTFFEKWHSLWIEGTKKGCSQDMPSLNQANYELGNLITEINGEWNCQISYNGLSYLHNAKIIHYFATSLVSFAHPYKLAASNIFYEIKEKGFLSAEIRILLQNPLTAFEKSTRIISDRNALDVLDSSLFYKLLWLRDKHENLFKNFNMMVNYLTTIVKRVFKYTKKTLRDNSSLS